MDEIKHLKLPYFEGLAAGYPSPAGDYQHESLDLNDKFVHHEEASYFVRVSGESMIFTPGLYADTYVIPLGDVVLAERGNNDAKVRLRIRSSGRSFTLRKKLLAGDDVNDAFAAILAKLSTV